MALNTRAIAAGGSPTSQNGGSFGSMKFAIKTPLTVRTIRPGRFQRKNARRPPKGPALAVQ
jgi:hypothetical protein